MINRFEALFHHTAGLPLEDILGRPVGEFTLNSFRIDVFIHPHDGYAQPSFHLNASHRDNPVLNYKGHVGCKGGDAEAWATIRPYWVKYIEYAFGRTLNNQALLNDRSFTLRYNFHSGDCQVEVKDVYSRFVVKRMEHTA